MGNRRRNPSNYAVHAKKILHLRHPQTNCRETFLKSAQYIRQKVGGGQEAAMRALAWHFLSAPSLFAQPGGEGVERL